MARSKKETATDTSVAAPENAGLEARVEKLEKIVALLEQFKVSKTQVMRDESYKLLWEKDLYASWKKEAGL